MLLVPVAAPAEQPTTRPAPGLICVTPAAGSYTAGIQEAIDKLPATGGVVLLGPGRYVLRRSVVLRDDVTVRGTGAATIITRPAEVSARLTRRAVKGEKDLHVDRTAGFRVGDEVAIVSDRMHGWFVAYERVAKAGPRLLTLAGPVFSYSKDGVFDPKQHAVVVNYFPAFRGGRRYDDKPVRRAAVERLVIDGNLQANPGSWRDFTWAAVHFANVWDSTVREVVVRGWVGDGIGVQGGGDVRVEGCFVEHCRGHGLHPGTALAGGLWTNNISRDNDGDGLFFCWQVVGITVTGNTFRGNRGCGVGGLGAGGRGGDRFNVVSANVCRDNGRWGIEATGGHDNTITGNVCLDNSRSRPGAFSGIGVVNTTATVVSGNRCGCDGETPTQAYGIEERGSSDRNAITGNVCAGNAQAGLVVVGRATQAIGNVGTLRRGSPPKSPPLKPRSR